MWKGLLGGYMPERYEAWLVTGAVFAALISFQVWLLSLPVQEPPATSPMMKPTASGVYPWSGSSNSNTEKAVRP